jgi:hypothetical protein
MLFEINSIFFIFTVFPGSPFVKFCVLYGGNFARRCRRCPWTNYAVDNRPTHCLRTSYPIPRGGVVSEVCRWEALCLYMYRIKKMAVATNQPTNKSWLSRQEQEPNHCDDNRHILLCTQQLAPDETNAASGPDLSCLFATRTMRQTYITDLCIYAAEFLSSCVIQFSFYLINAAWTCQFAPP